MKRFKEFINEKLNVRELMTAKSEEDISKIPVRRKLSTGGKYGYKGTEKEWNDYINLRPSSKINGALCLAAETGSDIGVRIALERGADPSFNDNYALLIAVRNGHIDAVKELLKDKRTDPSVYDEYTIELVKNKEIQKLLLSDDRLISKLNN